jgi:NAD(P)-dependent dehydrogenase (short-subunit alcohol dehydrogenase family)
MRTVVMTGGTAGFGAVAAQQIVNAPDTRLIVGARDIKASSIDTLPLDLARLASVRLFVEALGKTLGDNKIDALIMNAGAQFGTTKHRTCDGFESTFAINHLAHYLLLRLLTPNLAKNATVVATTSDVRDPALNPLAPTVLDPAALAHPQDEGNGFIAGFGAYASSKLCNFDDCYTVIDDGRVKVCLGTRPNAPGSLIGPDRQVPAYCRGFRALVCLSRPQRTAR